MEYANTFPIRYRVRNELEEAKEELIRAFEGDFKHTLETATHIEVLLRRVKAEMKGGQK